MKLPLSLIKTFVHTDLPPSKLGETLTLLGIEVDGIINERPSYAHVVVGEVLSARPHPNAEKLTVAEVSDGAHKVQVVCAAPNCRTGLKTAFAKVGALISDSGGTQRRIEKTSIRGVESHGMLCSAAELHLFSEADRILELPSETPAGQDLASIAWDPVLELSLTPNLGHCMSALGIARELAAGLQKPLLKPKIHLKENSSLSLDEKIEVSIQDPKLCRRYACRLIEGVKIGPSPFWLKKQIESCGLKPINNAVDAANFIMMKLGQPLHAFDFDKIEGSTLTAAPAEKPLPFLGLDGVQREVPAGSLMIWDTRKPLALAGIMGGENSAVSDGTTRILLEAAYFDPMAIRIAAKKTGLRTESSQRFEKGIDPEGVKEALDEAAQILQQVCGGTIASGAIDQYKHPFAPKPITCRAERTNQILGTKLSLSEIEEIFQRLGFKTHALEKGAVRVEAPPYRADLTEEIDLIEEVARIFGYNNIEKQAPRSTNSQIPHDPAYLFDKELRRRLVGLGLQEFLTCDLISPKLAAISQEISASPIRFFQTLHSKSEEYSVLRTSLLPGLLQVAKGNLDQKNQTFQAFEIGRIHFLQDGKPVELPMASILLTGKSAPGHWNRKAEDADFFDLKGLIENLFDGLRVEEYSIHPAAHLSLHPGRQANIHLDGLIVGSFGEVHPSLLEKFDIRQRLLYAELNLQHLIELEKSPVRMAPLPQFPASQRDWTVPLPPQTLVETIFDAIEEIRSPLLEKAELLDLFIPETGGQKNATFRFTYRDRLKTISFEEAESEHAKLLSAVSAKL